MRYLIFWLPALLVNYLLSGSGMAVQITLWFFGFFMLLGWAVNTGMAAYHYPYSTLSALFVYTGFNVLAVTIVYNTDFRSGAHIVLRAVGGFFSYKPLGALLGVLRAFPIPAELVVILTICGVCLIGYLVGTLQRRVSPDPYRPRMIRKH